MFASALWKDNISKSLPRDSCYKSHVFKRLLASHWSSAIGSESRDGTNDFGAGSWICTYHVQYECLTHPIGAILLKGLAFKSLTLSPSHPPVEIEIQSFVANLLYRSQAKWHSHDNSIKSASPLTSRRIFCKKIHKKYIAYKCHLRLGDVKLYYIYTFIVGASSILGRSSFL